MRKELEVFSNHMDDIITCNTIRKGEWRNFDLVYFKEKLTEEYAEVIEEFKKYKKGQCDKERVLSELTDLANICMMLFTLLNEKKELI